MKHAKGIDVSKWQGDFNLSKLDPECKFVFIRVAYGDQKDPKFSSHWSKFEGELYRGAYLFFRPELSPEDQANTFFEAFKGGYDGELPPVIDIEPYNNDEIGNYQWQKNAKLLMDIIEQITGIKPMIYTRASFFDRVFGLGYSFWHDGVLHRGNWDEYALWVAHYTKKEKPIIPDAWSARGWDFWQYTDKGDGIANGAESKELDLNYFYDDDEALDDYVMSSPIGDDWPNEHPEPDPNPDHDEPNPVKKYYIVSGGNLCMRSYPEVKDGNVMGWFKTGSIAYVGDVVEHENGDVWGKLQGQDLWFAIKHKGVTYAIDNK